MKRVNDNMRAVTDNMRKEEAPKGYRYIVRLRETHRIVGFWRNRNDACEMAWDWNQAHFGRGQVQVYIEELPEAVAKDDAPIRWVVGETTRPDAGGPLYVPVRVVDNEFVEFDVSPSHDRKTMEIFVAGLNARALALWERE